MLSMKIEPKNWIHGDVCQGLGNQMFMLANAYAYSLRYKTKLTVSGKWKELSKERPSYWDNLLHKFKKFTYDDRKVGTIYTEPEFKYNEIPKFATPMTLKGYYQSEEYFKDFRLHILDMFEFPESIKDFVKDKYRIWRIDDNTVTVAIHIRRGDYVKYPNVLHIQPLKYYEDAKQQMEIKLGVRPRYLYFSDDINWITENFVLEEQDIIVRGYKDYEEFALMSHCKNFIIANSTFSWWAAYLSYYRNQGISIWKPEGNADKYISSIIAPKTWFGVRGPKDWSSIYPQEWTIMNSKDYSVEDIFFMGIISCEKYKERREKQNLERNFLEYKYFIGKPELINDENSLIFEENIEENTVYLPCKDNYESLPQKVRLMMTWILQNRPKVKYIVKADDDVSFDFIKFKIYCKAVANSGIDYAGLKVKNKEHISKFHMGKTEDTELSETGVKIPKTIFAAGPCYFVSKNAAEIIVENLLTDCTILEDQSIGKCLEKHKINVTPLSIKKACKW